MARVMNWRATLSWVGLYVLLSGPALADEKVVFRCNFDEAVAPGGSEGSLVTGYEGSQSLLVELAEPGTRSRRFAIAAGQLDDRFATLRAVVWAYDLLNEAVEGTVADGLLNWRDLATKATAAIRAVDPGKPVVFEPGPWGGPDGFDVLEPLELDGVIYSFHMYRPHSFTHQGVYQDKRSIEYPGRIDGEFWDKERLQEEMLPAIEFQKAFNVQIYVGEFSAIRWAPGDSAYNYLRDVIDLFEQCRWDWSYHAFREWDGWSVGHGPDRNDHGPTKEPTKRMQLLLDWFAGNQRP